MSIREFQKKVEHLKKQIVDNRILEIAKSKTQECCDWFNPYHNLGKQDSSKRQIQEVVETENVNLGQ